jgi:ribosomal 30S subunit maturation factor RimM
MYTLKGELKVISDSTQVSEKFKKREFVVVDNSGQYPQTIQFQATQERCELLDSLKVGQNVEVSFFLRGREWTNPKDGVVRVFNSLEAYKIELLSSESATSDAPTVQGGDDLPF